MTYTSPEPESTDQLPSMNKWQRSGKRVWAKGSLNVLFCQRKDDVDMNIGITFKTSTYNMTKSSLYNHSSKFYTDDD